MQIQKQSQLRQTRQGSSRSSGIAGRLLGSRCRHLQHGKIIGSPVAYCYSYFSAMIRHESILGLIALQMCFKNVQNPMPGDLLHQDSNGSTLQYHPSFRHFRLQEILRIPQVSKKSQRLNSIPLIQALKKPGTSLCRTSSNIACKASERSNQSLLCLQSLPATVNLQSPIWSSSLLYMAQNPGCTSE